MYRVIINWIFQFSQEARLNLVPSKECKKFTKGMGFLPNREICAANKYIQRIDAYVHYYKRKRFKPRANKNCPYCPTFRRVKPANRLKDNEIRYRKTDFCSENSGGPLWKWMGKNDPKATVSHLHCLLNFSCLNFQRHG